ncbi:hypothetical protein JCM19233_3371 [Vibrio astriarenae]|nr:hypothetical protein JCM19233_3371 [Vibrio sp. C7]
MNELDIIHRINSLLTGIKFDESESCKKNKLPSTFIIGCPRSGTTALLQYLAQTQGWTYPTNFVTRFSACPTMGLLVQKLLFENSDEFNKHQQSIEMYSEYGRSQGLLNTNEFFHFYRRFFPNNEVRYITPAELEKVDVSSMIEHISNFVSLDNKPFLSKGMMFQYNLNFFCQHLSEDIFLYIKRDPLYNMQSLYLARLKEFGCVEQWWSAKPRRFDELEDMSVYDQIAGQVLFTEQEIEKELDEVPDDRKLVVNYEEFVKNPNLVLEQLVLLYEKKGIHLSSVINANTKIFNGNTKKVEDDVWSQLVFSYERINKMRSNIQ